MNEWLMLLLCFGGSFLGTIMANGFSDIRSFRNNHGQITPPPEQVSFPRPKRKIPSYLKPVKKEKK